MVNWPIQNFKIIKIKNESRYRKKIKKCESYLSTNDGNGR